MAHDRVEIRDVRPDDQPTLRRIQQAVIEEPSPQLLGAAVDGLGIGLVAVSDRPIGYVFALGSEQAVYVPEIAVDPAHHRQGVGTALLDAVIERAADTGANVLRLTVRADDERARAFYRENQFCERERLPDYYETGSGVGIVLSRPL